MGLIQPIPGKRYTYEDFQELAKTYPDIQDVLEMFDEYKDFYTEDVRQELIDRIADSGFSHAVIDCSASVKPSIAVFVPVRTPRALSMVPSSCKKSFSVPRPFALRTE
jgi:hypothetical protein